MFECAEWEIGEGVVRLIWGGVAVEEVLNRPFSVLVVCERAWDGGGGVAIIELVDLSRSELGSVGGLAMTVVEEDSSSLLHRSSRSSLLFEDLKCSVMQFRMTVQMSRPWQSNSGAMMTGRRAMKQLERSCFFFLGETFSCAD